MKKLQTQDGNAGMPGGAPGDATDQAIAEVLEHFGVASGPPTDFAEFARHKTREEFANACRFLFLLGAGTGGKADQSDFADDSTFTKPMGAEPGGKAGQIVLAVRKVQPMFPSMITVGRTTNNDITLPSPQISKFHAYFRLTAGRLELADAGSRNGTWVGVQRLAPKAPPVPVKSGDRIRFGHFELRLLDAGGCWDQLRRGG